ncbi:hypothetical protein DY000_02040397 [Brassica cretica]|uniref:Uncharacterized protein n=1 Tax=Brassica cretica TaxID=69181 RepID=A0ABQ7BG69_BRACR|nr:hypothetical protein DY000_02040397 [Brassica cretica]
MPPKSVPAFLMLSRENSPPSSVPIRDLEEEIDRSELKEKKTQGNDENGLKHGEISSPVRLCGGRWRFGGQAAAVSLQLGKASLCFVSIEIYLRYSLALQVYTARAQHFAFTWSSQLNTTSASATTSATTSGRTSYIFNLLLLASCADQAK